MSRGLMLIAAMIFGLSLLLFTDHQEAQAQTRVRDEIRFMPAVRGKNADAYGQWCVSQGWHESYQGYPTYPYPPGPTNSIDEVTQYGSPGWTWDNCHSSNGDVVDLATNGTTDGGTSCTTSSPCPSLVPIVMRNVYGNGCHAIEVDLYDFAKYDARTGTGEWKGKQRLLHTYTTTINPWTSTIYVAWAAWYYNWFPVGTIVGEPTTCPWQQPNASGPAGYHVHHDFMLPTASDSGGCVTGWNTLVIPASPGTAMDLWRNSSDNYVHFLTHLYGVACITPGDEIANFLLRSGGELDDTGVGTRQLAATGTPISTASMCFSLTITTASPQWCGTWNVAKQLIIAGFAHYKGLSPRDYFNGQEKPFPPSLDTSDHYWYGPDSGGYYFAMRVGYGTVWYPGTYQWGATCTYTASLGEQVYSVYFNSSALICGSWYAVFWTGGVPANMVTQAYSQFRGAGGMNPTSPATQDEANAWALNSDWSTIVKPHLDAVLRATQNPNDLNSVGVTVSDPNNSLDGKRW